MPVSVEDRGRTVEATPSDDGPFRGVTTSWLNSGFDRSVEGEPDQSVGEESKSCGGVEGRPGSIRFCGKGSLIGNRVLPTLA